MTQNGVLPEGAHCASSQSVRPFELDDLVLNAQFLPLEIGEGFGIGEGATDFLDDFRFEIGMPGAERFETILKRHETSPVIYGRKRGIVARNG